MRAPKASVPGRPLTCGVAAAGPSPVPFRPDLFWIAADAGLTKLTEAGLKPDLVIGDFDSLGFVPDGPVLRFPKRKDDTDTMLAVKEALRRGFRRICLYGAAGGRLDHTVANLQTLLYADREGAECYLCGETETATVLSNGSARFAARAAGRFSAFAVNGPAEGVTLTGLSYEAAKIALSPTFPLGVSNEFVGKEAVITVTNGTLLLIWDGSPEDRIG